MTMKFSGIENQGNFISEKVSTKPTWTAADEGRVIYVEDESTTYIGDSSDWVEPSGGGGGGTDTTIPLWESNGDLFWNDMSNISEWSLVGGVTQTTYGGKSCLKFPVSSSTVSAYFQTGGFPSRFVFTIRLLTDNLPDLSGDGFTISAYTGDSRVNGGWGANGMYVHDGSVWNPASLSFVQGEWQTWTLVHDDSSGASTARCDVYLNGLLVKKDMDSSLTTAGTDGRVYLYNSWGSGASTVYVDYVKVGTDFIQINQTEDYGVNQHFFGPTQAEKTWVDAGFVAGGNTGTYVSEINKLTFSNDTNNTLTSTLSAERASSAAFGSLEAGYVCGGYSPAAHAVIDKLTFSNDNANSISSGLSPIRSNAAGFNSSIAGYVVGGSTTSSVSHIITTISKLQFSSEHTSNLSSGITTKAQQMTGFESSLAGYAAGAYTASGATMSRIDKITFSSDIRSALGSSLSTNRSRGAGYNSTIAGYMAGGYNSIPTPGLDTIEKIAFADDTRSVLGSSMTYELNGAAGFDSTTAGYAFGGTTGAFLTTVDKLTFIDDNNSTIVSGLTTIAYATGFNTL